MSLEKLRLNNKTGHVSLPHWSELLIKTGQKGTLNINESCTLHVVIGLPTISFASSFIALGSIYESLLSSETEENIIKQDIDYWKQSIGKPCLFTSALTDNKSILARIESVEEIAPDGQFIKIKLTEKNKGLVRAKSIIIHESEAADQVNLTDIKGKLGAKISNNASDNASFTKGVLGRNRFEKLASNQNTSTSLVDSNNRFQLESQERIFYVDNRSGSLSDLFIPSNIYKHKHSKICKFLSSTKKYNGQIIESNVLILSGSNSILRYSNINKSKCIFYLLSKGERNFNSAREIIEDKFFSRNNLEVNFNIDPQQAFELTTFYT
mgnify:CR=1 FL=1